MIDNDCKQNPMVLIVLMHKDVSVDDKARTSLSSQNMKIVYFVLARVL